MSAWGCETPVESQDSVEIFGLMEKSYCCRQKTIAQDKVGWKWIEVQDQSLKKSWGLVSPFLGLTRRELCVLACVPGYCKGLTAPEGMGHPSVILVPHSLHPR